MLAALRNLQLVDGFDGVRVVVFAVAGAVCGKVVRADEALSGGVHGFEVERYVTAGPDVAVVGWLGASEAVAEFVALPLHGEAGVEIFADRLDRFDLDCGRQLGMQRTDQFFRIMLPVAIEVEALAVGMHAGIGASAAMGFNVGGEDLREYRFEVVLHRVAMGLALPPLKVRAVVGAYTFPTHGQHCVAFG